MTGKCVGELLHHFVVGGDETGMLASDGNVKVIGSIEKKKHEKILADSRCSISMYRTGCIAGDTGPTIFLCSGKKKRAGFTDKVLLQNGAAPGSTIIMTENAYMTNDAWEEMAPNIVKGIRQMPVVRDNPQWWVLEVFDGFGSHLTGLRAMKLRDENKILSLKEEGDSSHVNQAYDRFVARSHKAVEASDHAIQQAKELPPQELKDAIDDRKDANHGLV